MMGKALLLISQATSSGLVISEMARIAVSETGDVLVLLTNIMLVSTAATGGLFVLADTNKQYLYDTIKLGSYGPYLSTQTTEIHQACSALSGTSVLCTITGVRPIES